MVQSPLLTHLGLPVVLVVVAEVSDMALLLLLNTTVAVVVGAGGLNSTHDNLQATNGGPSSFGTPLTAGGGGFGGTRAPTPYFPGGAGNEYGGSGGGATWSGNPGAAGSNSTPHPGGIDAASPSTQGFGHAGQNVGPPQPYVGGGGGGAGGTNTEQHPLQIIRVVLVQDTTANGITGNAPDAVYYGGGGGGGLGTDGGTPSGSPDGTGGTGGDNDPHTNGTPGMENLEAAAVVVLLGVLMLNLTLSDQEEKVDLVSLSSRIA